jgi:hypothetical protein
MAMDPDASSASEEEWLEKIAAFNEAEVKAASEDGTLGHWRGVTSRYEVSVGPPPTARIEAVHRLLLTAFETFESAAENDDKEAMEEGAKLLGSAGERLVAITAEVTRSAGPPASRFPFDVPETGEITFASDAIVKRTKKSYGTNGLLLLTGNSLVFLTSEVTKSWSIPLSEITDVRKPWYGMSSYLTIDVNGAYYAFAFGQRPGRSVSGSLAGFGVAGDTIAASAMYKGGKLGSEWFSRLQRR